MLFIYEIGSFPGGVYGHFQGGASYFFFYMGENATFVFLEGFSGGAGGVHLGCFELQGGCPPQFHI